MTLQPSLARSGVCAMTVKMMSLRPACGFGRGVTHSACRSSRRHQQQQHQQHDRDDNACGLTSDLETEELRPVESALVVGGGVAGKGWIGSTILH